MKCNKQLNNFSVCVCASYRNRASETPGSLCALRLNLEWSETVGQVSQRCENVKAKLVTLKCSSIMMWLTAAAVRLRVCANHRGAEASPNPPERSSSGVLK